MFLRKRACLDGMLEILVRADVGIRTAESLIEKVRHELPGEDLSDAQAVKGVLRKEILRMLSVDKQWSLVPQSNTGTPTVVLMAGVNCVGTAVDQLEEWAKRAGAECERLMEGADPASVDFDCVKRAVF
ncbi:MAG: signal recognition particle receptor subunit alpha [Silvanigrellaceae bacterium]